MSKASSDLPVKKPKLVTQSVRLTPELKAEVDQERKYISFNAFCTTALKRFVKELKKERGK